MKYCIDTSSLLDAWHRWYPPSIFPGVWEKLDGLIAAGGLVSSEEVLRELERKEDELYQWSKERKNMFLPLDESVQSVTSEILADFPTEVDGRPGKSFADPFVIATERVTRTTVVTGEKPTGNPNRPKIPDICRHYSIPCVGITEMFQREKWTF